MRKYDVIVEYIKDDDVLSQRVRVTAPTIYHAMQNAKRVIKLQHGNVQMRVPKSADCIVSVADQRA